MRLCGCREEESVRVRVRVGTERGDKRAASEDGDRLATSQE